MPADEHGHELLLRELGRINSELVAQRRLSAMTVHDLANPTQVILGLSELLLEHPALDPFVRHRLEQMHRSAVTISAMISDLRRGFALDDPASLGFQRLNLAELATSVIERMRLLADAKEIRLQLAVEQGGNRDCWVRGDAVKLERALVNLLGNAIKFSPRRSTVSMALGCGPDQAKITVRDQGPGITPEGRERIFEVFHREGPAADLPGQGLGLFITRQIVEQHGGDITVESIPGQGATFLVQLPLVDKDFLADLT